MSRVAVPPILLRVEIDVEVEVDMGDPRLERPGEAVHVLRVGGGQDRGDGAGGGRFGRLVAGAASGQRDRSKHRQQGNA